MDGALTRLRVDGARFLADWQATWNFTLSRDGSLSVRKPISGS